MISGLGRSGEMRKSQHGEAEIIAALSFLTAKALSSNREGQSQCIPEVRELDMSSKKRISRTGPTEAGLDLAQGASEGSTSVPRVRERRLFVVDFTEERNSLMEETVGIGPGSGLKCATKLFIMKS
jgi:hypothetical protein